jgi:deoxyribodipyrimidine photolyase
MPEESIPPAAVVWFRRDLRLSGNPGCPDGIKSSDRTTDRL